MLRKLFDRQGPVAADQRLQLWSCGGEVRENAERLDFRTGARTMRGMLIEDDNDLVKLRGGFGQHR